MDIGEASCDGQDRMTLEDDMDTEKELLRLLPIQTQVRRSSMALAFHDRR